MNKNVKKFIAVFLSAIMVLSAFAVMVSAEDSQKTVLKLQVLDEQFSIGDRISLLLSVENASKLSSMDCDVLFDAQMLNFIDMKKADGFTGKYSNWNYWDAGHAQFDCSFAESFSGTTDIAVLIFDVLSDGQTDISVNINIWEGEDQPDDLSFSLGTDAFADGSASIRGLSYELIDGCLTLTACDEMAQGELVIPDSINGYPVTAIAEGAFAECSQITSITIPATVTDIGRHAFYHCPALEKFIVDENNQNYSSDEHGVLFDKAKSKLLRYPIGSAAEEYIIPDGVTVIGESAFAYAENIKEIKIPETVTTIEVTAFLSTWKLESIVIPDSVTKLTGNAFSCSGIKSAVLPAGINTIETRLFDCCTSLESVIIPANITNIDDFAFSMCDKLKNVYFVGSQEEWNNIVVSDVENSALQNAEIHYGFNGVSVYDVDFNGNITAADARLALRVSAGLETLSAIAILAADVDANGNITAADARLILRKSAGLE